LLKGVPLIVPELYWKLIGEKIAGGAVMYKDVWVLLEPLSAGFYRLFAGLQNPYSGLKMASIALVLFQAFFFNFLCNNNNLFNRKTFFPALFYIIFSNLFFDFLTTPPVLLGLCFLLPALHLIIIQVRLKLNDQSMLLTGILIALASLFFLPFIAFLLIFLITLPFFVAATFRRYLLLFLGFLLPFLLTILYYFYQNGANTFFAHFLFPYFLTSTNHFIELKFIGLILLLPIISSFLGIWMALFFSNYINYQFKIFKLMLVWLLAGVIAFLLSTRFAPSQLYTLVPAFAYFSTHYFLLQRKKLFAEIVFWVILLGVFCLATGFLYGFPGKIGKPEIAKQLIVQQAKVLPPISLKGKKIVVLGYDPALYRESMLATPYLNWELAKKQFSRLDNFQAISIIYRNFQTDLPDVIIDEEQVMPKVFKRIPILEEQYMQRGNGVWVLKPSSAIKDE